MNEKQLNACLRCAELHTAGDITLADVNTIMKGVAGEERWLETYSAIKTLLKLGMNIQKFSEPGLKFYTYSDEEHT
jgi:hypothetical protein